ncbi:RING finger protein 25 [Chamberlinius hualienensis]
MSQLDCSQSDDHGVSMELEAIQAIYIHELEISYCPETNIPKVVSINLHPATADNANEQYVRLTLVLKLSPNYPNELPEITIKSPRGLSDTHIERISKDLNEHAQQSRGNAMLFELIEIAKEHLTQGNTPSCVCTICLYGFNAEDVFTKTDCYHYFHSHCLKRFVEASLSEPEIVQPSFKETQPLHKILCPVCREPFKFDKKLLEAPPPPIQSETAPSFHLDEDLKQLQHQMSELFVMQKSKGGIIDLEEEKNKFLIEISSVQSSVDVEMHVNRPAFVNNASASAGAKKKSKNKKKNTSNEKAVPKSASMAAVTSRDEHPTTSSSANFRHTNQTHDSGRRRNYKRTEMVKLTNDDAKVVGRGQSSSRNFNVDAHFKSENGGGKTTGSYAGRHKFEGKSSRVRYNKNAQSVESCLNKSPDDELPTDATGCSKNSLNESRDDGSSLKIWSAVSQPLVVTGPPNMAFTGSVNKFKKSAVRAPPGFETPFCNENVFDGNRSSSLATATSAAAAVSTTTTTAANVNATSTAGFLAVLPPAGFQSVKPPPGFGHLDSLSTSTQ